MNPSHRLRAALLVGSLGLSALAVLPAAQAQADAAGTTVVAGHIDWGVKQSFRSYVTGPAGQGSVATSGGASVNGDGTFRFPVGSGALDPAAPVLTAGATGGVQFLAHAGALDLTFSNLTVEADGSGATLVADVVSRRLSDGGYDTFDDIALADLDLDVTGGSTSGVDRTWTAVPAVLTADGSTAFGGFYAAGTALDPLTLTATLDGEAPVPSTSTTVEPTVPTTVDPTDPVDPTPPPVDGPDGERTATGPQGQTLTVRPAKGLDPAGATVSVHGEGYDTAVGIYLAFCVDQGPGLAPSPCFGGADQTNESPSSVWITDDPPTYAEGLTEPFGAGGTLDFDLTFSSRATDSEGTTIFDCLDGETRCVVTTRADHTASSNRSADVKVPVTFAGQEEVEEPAPPAAPWASVDVSSVRPGETFTVSGGGFAAGEQVEVWVHSDPRWLVTAVADPSGAVRQPVTLPLDLAAGTHHLELVGISSGATAATADFTVTAVAPAAATGTLPLTGWSPGLLLVAATLLALGGGLLLASGQIARSASAQYRSRSSRV